MHRVRFARISWLLVTVARNIERHRFRVVLADASLSSGPSSLIVNVMVTPGRLIEGTSGDILRIVLIVVCSSLAYHVTDWVTWILRPRRHMFLLLIFLLLSFDCEHHRCIVLTFRGFPIFVVISLSHEKASSTLRTHTLLLCGSVVQCLCLRW